MGKGESRQSILQWSSALGLARWVVGPGVAFAGVYKMQKTTRVPAETGGERGGQNHKRPGRKAPSRER